MKVIFPVKDNENCKTQLARGFHNAEFVCIYDSESQTYKWLAAKEISSKPGNLCLELKRKGIFTVISPSIAIMALGLFNELGLKVFKAQGDSLVENVQLYQNSQLKPFLNVAAIGAGGCGGACNVCEVECS